MRCFQALKWRLPCSPGESHGRAGGYALKEAAACAEPIEEASGRSSSLWREAPAGAGFGQNSACGVPTAAVCSCRTGCFWEEPMLEQFMKNCSPREGSGICAPKCFGALCEGLYPIGRRPRWSRRKTVRKKEQQRQSDISEIEHPPFPVPLHHWRRRKYES